jgi:hypothetical protein
VPAFNALYEAIIPVVSEQEKVEIWRGVALKMAEENQRRIKEMFPRLLVAPGIDAGGEVRLSRYMMKLIEAHPEDEDARQAELYALLDPDYLKAIKLGLLSPPLSRPWSVLVKVPWLFLNRQQDLRRLYLRHVRGIE